jgi:predicted permease
MSILRRIANLLQRSKLDQEIEAELRSHIEMRTADNMATGMSPEEARRQAVLRFGSRAAMKERVIAADAQMFVDSLWQDLCYGLRQLRRNPGFTAVAVLTIALCIGASSAMFSALYGLVLRPLPYHNASRLVMLWDSNRATGAKHITVMEGSFPILQREAKAFEGMAAFGPFTPRNQTSASKISGTEERVCVGAVTSQFFHILGVAPILGRLFLPSEDVATGSGENLQRAHVGILSYAFWREHYGASPDVLGKTFSLSEWGMPTQYTIVGVMPKDFAFPYPLDPEKPDLWLSLSLPDRFSPGNILRVIGRLKPSVTLSQAQAEINTIADGIRAQYPKFYKKEYVSVVPLSGELIRNVRSLLWMLLAAFSFILLIGCANVGNLLLVRAVSREREMAIRATLGAGRGALIRQTVTEALLLAVAGGALGLLLAYWALHVFLAVLPASIYIPRLDSLALDVPTLALAAAFSVIAAAVFSLLPSLRRLTRPNLNETMKSGSARQANLSHSVLRRPGSVLLLFEVSLALVLLTGTLLMLRSMGKLLAVNSKFQPEHLLSLDVNLSNPYVLSVSDDSSFVALYQQFQERVAALPGVESVALADDFPIVPHAHPSEMFKADSGGGRIAEAFQPAFQRVVTSAFFPMMDMNLVRGRWFEDADGLKSLPVAVINEEMAKRYWPDRDPLGLKIEPYLRYMTEVVSYTIVGIVREPTRFGSGDTPDPTFYLDYSQVPLPSVSVIVRTVGMPQGIAAALRSAALQIVPGQMLLGNVQTGHELVSEETGMPRFTTQLLTTFSSLALLLAVVGIYGLISYYTSRRTHEIGVRMALGAQRSDVMRLVLGEGMTLTAFGVAIGLAVSYWFTKSLGSFLYGVSATDFDSFTAAAVVFFIVALLACYIPARRAMRVDPMVALRYE